MDAEAATRTQEIVWTIYDILAPALTAAVSYVAIWLTGVIRARVKNDIAAGLLQRLTESVTDAVKAVNQRQRELVGNAHKVDSPGGRKLTSNEAATLRRAAIDYVKAYWGPKGLRMLARILVDGERDTERASGQIDRVIEAKIEAAVSDTKRSAGTIVTRVPDGWDGSRWPK